MERVHEVILNTLVTNDLDNMVVDHIYPWSETLASISWEIRASYHRAVMATPIQAVFGRDMLCNLMPVVNWQVVTAAKDWQVDIDNVQENDRWIMHDYAIGNWVYVEINGIYLKLDYNK